jgi:hypothetical protein
MNLKRILLVALLAVGTGAALSAVPPGGQDQIQRARIFQDDYPIVFGADFDCSFYMIEELPALRISVFEGNEGRTLIGDGQRFWVDAGKDKGLKEGQPLLIVDVVFPLRTKVEGFNLGPVGARRGVARILQVHDVRSLAVVEKGCGRIQVGCYLLPYVTREPISAKDQGFAFAFREGEALTGRIVYLLEDLVAIGSRQWALIDMGVNKGLQVGRQLTVFQPSEGGAPPRAIANVIVIDVGPVSATVKVLSNREAVRLANFVQAK